MKKIFTFGLIGVTACVALIGCGKKADITETSSVPNIQTVETIESTENTTSTTPYKNDDLIDTIESTENTISSSITTISEQIEENTTSPSTTIIPESEQGEENSTTFETNNDDAYIPIMIQNGNDETIYVNVGDYVDLSEAIGGAYSVGNVTILSGDAITVMGKGSIMAEKKGTVTIRATLMDEETNTRTESDFVIVAE